MNALKSLILKNSSFFGKVQDYFFTTECQQRGNEYEYRLLWNEGAPVYGMDANYAITSFVDHYLST